MIIDSPELLQTERSTEGYKYPYLCSFFELKQKSVCPLFPTNSYIYSAGKETVFLRSIFLVISEHFFYIRATHFHLRRGLAFCPGLGADDLTGALPLGEEVILRSGRMANH